MGRGAGGATAIVSGTVYRWVEVPDPVRDTSAPSYNEKIEPRYLVWGCR